MSVADIAVLVVVLLSGLIALRLGLVRVILGLSNWIGATLATIYSYDYARSYAREWIGNEILADIAAGAAIFLVSMVVLTAISHAIAGGVRDSSFGILDRSFGLLAGLAIGGVIVSSGYVFSQQVLKITDESSFYKGAKTLPLIKHGATILVSAAPTRWGLVASSSPAPNRDSQFRNLLSPKPENHGTERGAGYKPAERLELDRLIQSHQ